jgi:hypothetical protein
VSVPAAVIALLGCAPDAPYEAPPHETVYLDDTIVPATDTGAPPPVPVRESFVYTPPPVDVLFVIDSSCSMGEARETLLASLDGILAAWVERNLDFHAGVINIDSEPDQGLLVAIDGARWVDRTSAQPATLLRAMVDSVPSISSDEEGREGIWRTLEATGTGEPNEGFVRPDSDLAILVHTDTDDQSDLPSPGAFVEYLLALRPDADRRGFHTIVSEQEYLDLTAAIGGIAWNLSNTPYGPALEAISDTLEGDNAFPLSVAAVPASITARVTEPDGTVVDLANPALTWNADTLEVGLGTYFPTQGAVVDIDYLPQ